MAEKVTEKNSGLAYQQVLTNSATHGIVRQSEYFDRIVAGKNHLDAYYVVNPNDYVYNPRISKEAPCGPINRNTLELTGIASPLYLVFRVSSQSLAYEFLDQYFKTANWFNYMKLQGNSGARSDRFTIADTDFFSMPVRIPSLPEQRRIGEFFSAIDNLIAAAERQEALLRQKKQAYLQLMFPKEGETEPLVRFAGFNEQWQQRQLGEVAEIVGGGTPDSSNADYWDGDIDWYIPSEIGESRIVQASARKITREGLNHSSARLLPAGSILFTSRASIGLMAFISHPSATNQGFQSLIPNGEVDPDFLYALGPCISRYAKKHAAGSTFIEISGSSLAKAPLRIPRLPEQRLIGQLFSTFDKIISAAEQQIESLQMSKAAYLQRMFI